MNVTLLDNDHYTPSFTRTSLTDRLRLSFDIDLDTKIIKKSKLKSVVNAQKKGKHYSVFSRDDIALKPE